jgi:hypothetical protein
MKFYIASSLKNIEKVRQVAENLKRVVFNIHRLDNSFEYRLNHQTPYYWPRSEKYIKVKGQV